MLRIKDLYFYLILLSDSIKIVLFNSHLFYFNNDFISHL